MNARIRSAMLPMIVFLGGLSPAQDTSPVPKATWDIDKEVCPKAEANHVRAETLIRQLVDEANARHPGHIPVTVERVASKSGEQWQTNEVTGLRLHQVPLLTAVRFACEATAQSWSCDGRTIYLYLTDYEPSKWSSIMMTARVARAIGVDPEHWTAEQVRAKFKELSIPSGEVECHFKGPIIFFDEISPLEMERINAMIRLWEDGYSIHRMPAIPPEPDAR
jgi:hypothetical protein